MSNAVLPDKPLENPNDDRLGYKSFAYHIAQSFTKISKVEGLVVAIYGQWGSGKTTVSNFIKYNLLHQTANKPIIVEFNPWWFTGDDDLIKQFFNQLLNVLKLHPEVSDKIKNGLAEFAELVSDLEIDGPWYIKLGIKLMKLFGLIKENSKDVSKLKETIAKELKKQDRKIIVFIDDIDRLTSEEIRQMFKLVKAVADFPNVIYLLVFDKSVATKALESTQELSGEDYLEKIIQVPFELPLPDKPLLRSLLFEKLNQIIFDVPNEQFSESRWASVYFDSLDHFIQTPRDIVRFFNTLNVTFEAVKGEVDTIDFLGIESYRVFIPKVYEIIRSNPEKFTGIIGHGISGEQDEKELRDFHNKWLDELPNDQKPIIKEGLPHLFPKLEAVWGRSYHSYDSEIDWRNQSRVCTPEFFPVYFRLLVPENSVSNSEMGEILNLTKNSRKLSSKLEKLSRQFMSNGISKVSIVLEKFRDYIPNKISRENLPSILESLFDTSDRLPEDQEKSLFAFGNDIRVGRVVWVILKQFSQDEAFELLKKLVKKGKALTTIVHEIAVIGQQHEKSDSAEKDQNPVISRHQLQELEKIALGRIRQSAKNNTLINRPDLLRILYRWRDWGTKDEVSAWLNKVTKNTKGLIKILVQFLNETKSSSGAGLKIIPRLDPKWLEEFIDTKTLYNKAIKINMKSLNENEKLALNTFLKEYKLRAEGKNPYRIN